MIDLARAQTILSSPTTERNALLVLLVWATLLQTLVIVFFPISISNDSWQYIQYAGSLFDNKIFQRTIGFPFLLAMTGVPESGTAIFFVFVQSLMAISMPFLVYFAMRPFSRFTAYLAAFVGASTLYPYVFSLQFLTEASFLWLTTLLGFFLSRYFFTGRLLFLMLAVFTTFAIALVRVSGTAQFGCIVLAVAFAALLAWRRREAWLRYVRHGAIAIALFGVGHVAYGMSTDRTASTIMPYFVFNWVYRGGTEINYGIVDAENGPRTREFLIELEQSLRKNPTYFRALAQYGSEEVREIGSQRWVYDDEDVHALMHDLVDNTTNPHRGFMMPWNMAADLGSAPTSKLLWGTIIEAFLAHPEVLLHRAERALKNIPDGLNFTPGPVLYVTGFWQQVPAPGQASNRSAGAGIMSEWLYGLNLLAGSDPIGRDRTGHFPTNFEEAKTAFSVHRNLTGFANYIVFVNSQRILPFTWVLMLAGIFFVFWSRNPALGLGLLLLSTLPPFLSVLVSEVDTRHFWMAFPVQLMAASVTIDGAFRFIRYILGDRRFG